MGNGRGGKSVGGEGGGGDGSQSRVSGLNGSFYQGMAPLRARHKRAQGALQTTTTEVSAISVSGNVSDTSTRVESLASIRKSVCSQPSYFNCSCMNLLVGVAFFFAASMLLFSRVYRLIQLFCLSCHEEIFENTCLCS